MALRGRESSAEDKDLLVFAERAACSARAALSFVRFTASKQHLLIYPFLLLGVPFLVAVVVHSPDTFIDKVAVAAQAVLSANGLALALSSLAVLYVGERGAAAVNARMSQTELALSAAVGTFAAYYNATALAGVAPPHSRVPFVGLTCLWAGVMRAGCSRKRYALDTSTTHDKCTTSARP